MLQHRLRRFHLTPGVLFPAAALFSLWIGWHMVPRPSRSPGPVISRATQTRKSSSASTLTHAEPVGAPTAPLQPPSADAFESQLQPPHIASRAGNTESGRSSEKRLERFWQQARMESSAELSPAEQETSPDIAGHALSASGFRIALQSISHPGGSTQPQMDALFIPETASPQVLTTVAVPASAQGIWVREPNSRIGIGLTEEELAFRAKWGWAAFDAALRTAFLLSHESAP